MKNSKEIREFIGLNVLDDEMKLVGSIKYNKESEYMGFIEIMTPTAFNKTLADGYDVRAYFGHDTNKVIGRVKNGSLELVNTPTELQFVIHMPDTQEARDYYNLVKDGYVSGVSFGMIVIKETNEVRDGVRYRYINECALREISVVSEPAYPSNTVDARNLEEEKEVKEIKDLSNEAENTELPKEESEVVETDANPTKESPVTDIKTDTLTEEEQKSLNDVMNRLLELEEELNKRGIQYGLHIR